MKAIEAIRRPVNQNIILMVLIDLLCLFFTSRYTYYISYIINHTDRADFLFYKLINFLFGSYIGIAEYISTVLIFVFSVIARITFSNNKNRIIVYRILMGVALVISCFALIIPIVILGAGSKNSEMLIFCQIFRLALAAAMILGIANTYSKRIFK